MLSSSSLAAPDQASNPHPRLAAHGARPRELRPDLRDTPAGTAALTSTTVTAPSAARQQQIRDMRTCWSRPPPGPVSRNGCAASPATVGSKSASMILASSSRALIPLRARSSSPTSTSPNNAACLSYQRELANRQARHHLSKHHAIQGRLGELAISPAIPHADPIGTALMPGMHSRDTVTGPAPGHAATPSKFSPNMSQATFKRHSIRESDIAG